MKYNEFEKRPFGAVLLLATISSWSLYLYLMIDIIIALSSKQFSVMLFILSFISVIMILIQLIIVSFTESVVGMIYNRFWITLGKILYFTGSSIVELVFRRQYLKLYNLLNSLLKLEEVMEKKTKHFKEENERLK